MKKFLNWLVFLFTGKGSVADNAVDAGICDFGGQGRDMYGH